MKGRKRELWNKKIGRGDNKNLSISEDNNVIDGSILSMFKCMIIYYDIIFKNFLVIFERCLGIWWKFVNKGKEWGILFVFF